MGLSSASLELFLFALIVGATALQRPPVLNRDSRLELGTDRDGKSRSTGIARRDADAVNSSRAGAGSGAKLCSEECAPESSAGQGHRGAYDSPHLNFLAFFPCTCGQESIAGCSVATLRQCDVFLYAAVLLAVEHVNNDSRVLHYPEYEHNGTLCNITDTEVLVVDSETRVCFLFVCLYVCLRWECPQ